MPSMMARAGFTTVRDLGGDTSAGHRDARRGSRKAGSRARGSRYPAPPLSIIGGHADDADGPAARNGGGGE